ncbi:ABC transporter ATP-binding protein [Alkalilimnicola ehrlichii]|nr:ATP-binding cassette domain-containing protein [Alkalilimnicola ehrlichii]
MPINPHVLEALDIETRFGEQVVHRDLTLTVRRGETLAIVGSSGSGKTVLLRELILLAKPSRGRIRLFDTDVNALSEPELIRLRSRLGVMFQHGALFTSLTVRENIDFPLREHTALGPALRRDIALLKLELAGLPASAANKYPDELSGGMIKRAALARALALDPKLLFLDEPTSGLDPVGAADFDDLIMELKTLLDLTIVMVTHDPDSLWRIADRVAFLGEKKVLQVAPAAELARIDHPDIRAYFHGKRMQQAQERAWKPA